MTERPINLRYYGKVMYRSAMSREELLRGSSLELPRGTQISWQGSERGKSFSMREATEGVITVTAAAVVADDEACGSTTGTTSGNESSKKERLRRHFEDFPSPVLNIIDSLEVGAVHEDFVRDVDVPDRWYDADGPAVIVGDAAHAMTPHMGQGANVGLEDVCELVHRVAPLLRQRHKSDTNSSGGDLESALHSYCQSRLARVKEVQEQSRRNTLQSNTFDKQTASIPFERRRYSESFKERLYAWKPPRDG